jgi:hypothetical protein
MQHVAGLQNRVIGRARGGAVGWRVRRRPRPQTLGLPGHQVLVEGTRPAAEVLTQGGAEVHRKEAMRAVREGPADHGPRQVGIGPEELALPQEVGDPHAFPVAVLPRVLDPAREMDHVLAFAVGANDGDPVPVLEGCSRLLGIGEVQVEDHALLAGHHAVDAHPMEIGFRSGAAREFNHLGQCLAAAQLVDGRTLDLPLHSHPLCDHRNEDGILRLQAEIGVPDLPVEQHVVEIDRAEERPSAKDPDPPEAASLGGASHLVQDVHQGRERAHRVPASLYGLPVDVDADRAHAPQHDADSEIGIDSRQLGLDA